jgi:hypothetical protein
MCNYRHRPSYSEKAVYDAWPAEDLRTALSNLAVASTSVHRMRASGSCTHFLALQGMNDSRRNRKPPSLFETEVQRAHMCVPFLTANTGKLYNLDAVAVGHVGRQDAIRTVVVATNQTSWRL